MNIVFVCPTWTDDLGVFARIARKRNSQPALGILYLAAVAEKRGHKVWVIDADVEGFDGSTLIDGLMGQHVDILGISATSPIFHKGVELAKGLKSRGFKAPILIGGEHINIFKKEAFFDCFDYGFFGESDRSFKKFLDIVENGAGDLAGIKGLIYRQNGRVIQGEQPDIIRDLDDLDFPAMHLLKHERYMMTFVKFNKRRYLPIMATRGCPFKCAFCSEPMTNPIVRFRSPENIVDEIAKWVKDLGIRHYFFLDSNLTLKRSQIEGVCKEIMRRNLRITFEGWTRANLVDREVLTLMKRAGLIRISYGIESGDPNILKIIRKEVSHKDMLRAFKITDELGIEPACSLMLGLPGETKASVERSIDFVRSIPQVMYSNFSIANPYPGTEMYKWALTGKHGMNLRIKDFSEFRRYDYSPITVNDLTEKDLVQLQKIGLLKIHFTPKRMLAAIKMLGLAEIVPVFFNMLAVAWQSLYRGEST